MLQTLSVVWDFDPVLFRLGSIDIRYYGLMWALAILIAAKFFDNFVKRNIYLAPFHQYFTWSCGIERYTGGPIFVVKTFCNRCVAV